jgi:hypothetical protein
MYPRNGTDEDAILKTFLKEANMKSIIYLHSTLSSEDVNNDYLIVAKTAKL